jgi:transposase-like protein
MELCFAKTLYNCPTCASSSIRRSARAGFVERVFLRLALVWPYRCDDCNSRFWGFQRSVPQPAKSQELKAA